MGAQWKVKHKEVAANAKGRIFTKLTKEIMVAARNGADPDMNPRLRLAVEQAKKASMTRETLERAIKKGAGLLDEAMRALRRIKYPSSWSVSPIMPIALTPACGCYFARGNWVTPARCLGISIFLA
jgi:hypothetical protein